MYVLIQHRSLIVNCPNKFCVPGGNAEKIDITTEDVVNREFGEETGLYDQEWCKFKTIYLREYYTCVYNNAPFLSVLDCHKKESRHTPNNLFRKWLFSTGSIYACSGHYCIPVQAILIKDFPCNPEFMNNTVDIIIEAYKYITSCTKRYKPSAVAEKKRASGVLFMRRHL
jgi:hypothetical protein